MTSLWFPASLAVAIAVAGPMTVTAAVAVTIPSKIHRRISRVRMMKPPNKAEEKIEHTIHIIVRADRTSVSSAPLIISPGGRSTT
jgi:hypothetical protein